MAMDNRAFIQLQLEALSIWHYITKYDEFERKVKTLFSDNISRVSPEKKQILYFFLAGIKCSARIEYVSNSLKTDDAKFSSNEKFNQLSLSQMIKIQRQNNIMDFFEFNIPSINNRTAEYTFTDCCIKLLSMRNKLAHEMAHLSFGDKDIIELLSNEQIKNNSAAWFATMDTDIMNGETKCIFSNLIMLEQIKKLLIEREANYEHQTMDNF